MAPFKNHERLSELVKMYPCLYNKQEKEFKKEEVKQRAWKEIAEEIGLENGKAAEQQWKNLKKLLSKRRMRLKEVDVSGAAAGPVNKARRALEELNYLSWLFPFVKVRTTKSNISSAKEDEEDEDFDENLNNVDQNEADTNNECDDINEEMEATNESAAENSLQTRAVGNAEEEERDTPRLKRKLTGKVDKVSKVKVQTNKREKTDIEKEELKALQVINKLASAEENKGECEIFGELIAAELKTLDQRKLFLAKHEIQNVIFKIRMQALESDVNGRPTALTRTATHPPSTSSPVVSSVEESLRPITQPAYQPFQPQHSDGFGMNPLDFFMQQVQGAASYSE